jgi:hypothetical protein
MGGTGPDLRAGDVEQRSDLAGAQTLTEQSVHGTLLDLAERATDRVTDGDGTGGTATGGATTGDLHDVVVSPVCC